MTARQLTHGMGWYTPESWAQLQAVAEDTLAGSFDDFVQNATQLAQEMEAQGIKVEKMYIDVDHMVAWCKRHGYRVDSQGRTVYGCMLTCHDGELFDLDTPVDDRTRMRLQ